MTEVGGGHSSGRLRLVSCVGVLAGVVVLAAVLEFGLALAGLGEPLPGRESALAYQHVFPPVLVPRSRADGQALLATADPRLVRDEILRDKSAGALRVCVFGGSATFGLGHAPNAAFPALLERLLARAAPNRTVEVLNLGVVALSSRGVAALCSDALASADPDLLVVYSGNNEFLEPHSERYFAATASPLARARRALARTRLVRLARSLRGPQPRPTITSRDIASQDARIDHRTMLASVALSEAEVQQVIDDYARNLHAIADAARAADVPLVVMTVASNWRWWALADLEPLDDGERAQSTAERGERERLHRAALAAEAAGDHAAARAAFRGALEADEHLRRATDAHAAAVRALAAEQVGAELFDSIEYLAARAPHGILGFETFYDYVHFTPQGALMLARGLAERLIELGLVDLTPAAFAATADQVDREWKTLLAAPREGWAVDDWIGFGDDPSLLTDRDLWKYDRLADELDHRLVADPTDALARTWRGNQRAFVNGQAPAARADYEAALDALGNEADESVETVQANLARLR